MTGKLDLTNPISTQKVMEVITTYENEQSEKEEFLDNLEIALKDMLNHFNGEINHEILSVVDKLYDKGASVRKRVAHALGISVPKINRLLGKRDIYTCIRCNSDNEIFILRSIGGHRKKPDICGPCREKEREENRRKWEAEEFRRASEAQSSIKMHFDSITREVELAACSSNPSEVGSFGEKLHSLLSIWIGDQQSDYFTMPGGCMECGVVGRQIRPYLPKNGVTGVSPIVWKSLRNGEVSRKIWPEYHSPRLTFDESYRFYSPIQAIMMIDSQMYFPFTCLLPLDQRPMLILCSECAKPYVNNIGYMQL